MIAYLDTQVVVRLIQGDHKRISRKARSLIERSTLLISPMVALEAELLYELGRVKLPWREARTKLVDEVDFGLCDLPFARVAEVALGESWTRDPFDRMIVAQAKANGLAHLISSDEHIQQHYSGTVW